MESKTASTLKRELERQLKTVLPQFTKSSGKGPPLYSWRTEGGLTFFLLLVIDPHWDRFTLEAAWHTGGEFPWNGDLFESPFTLNSTARRFRLVRLWDDKRSDYWWELASPSDKNSITAALRERPGVTLPDVAALVGDALERIKARALPYFEEVRRAHSGRATSEQ